MSCKTCPTPSTRQHSRRMALALRVSSVTMSWMEPVYAVALTLVIAVVVALCVQWREGRVDQSDHEDRSRVEEHERRRAA